MVVVAKYDFDGDSAEDLPFRRGDRIVVISRGEGEEGENWWKGRTGDREGMFPGNFVDVLVEDGGEISNKTEDRPWMMAGKGPEVSLGDLGSVKLRKTQSVNASVTETENDRYRGLGSPPAVPREPPPPLTNFPLPPPPPKPTEPPPPFVE